MDYKRFLNKSEEQVLPYFGGGEVVSATRSLRVAGPLEAGWWRFEIRGRQATAQERVEQPEGLDLPKVRGHLLGARLVGERGDAARLAFLPEDEPPLFSPVTGLRWHSGDLLFGQLEFETEVEEAARQALEDGRGLAGVKGVPASLRAAFAYALAAAVGRERGIHATPLELRAAIVRIAEGGPGVAAAEIDRLNQRRRAQRILQSAVVSGAPSGPQEERVAAALASAGARLLRLRRMAGDQLEVTYRFLEGRFQSIVDANTLQVYDAGVCLAGEDSLVTLESLPGVIREAVETGELVITRQVSDDA